MIERPLAFGILALPLLWVVALILPPFGVAVVPVAIAWAICAATGAVVTVRQVSTGWLGVGVLGGLVVVSAIASGEPSLFGSVGPELAVGVLLGLPWVLIGYLSMPSEGLGYRFAGFGLTVTWGLLLLATLQVLTGSGSAVTGASFFMNFVTVAGQQVLALGSLVTGAVTPALPVHALFDPVYAALTGISVLGLLIVSVRPQTGRAVSLPIAVRWSRGGDAARELSASYGFSSAQHAAFRERSSAEPPLTTWPPGLAPVLCGAVAAAAFLLAGYWEPYRAVLGVTVAFAVLTGALVLITDAPGWFRSPQRRPRVSPSPPAPVAGSPGPGGTPTAAPPAPGR